MKNRRFPSFAIPVLTEDLVDERRAPRHSELTWLRGRPQPRGEEPRPHGRREE